MATKTKKAKPAQSETELHDLWDMAVGDAKRWPEVVYCYRDETYVYIGFLPVLVFTDMFTHIGIDKFHHLFPPSRWVIRMGGQGNTTVTCEDCDVEECEEEEDDCGCSCHHSSPDIACTSPGTPHMYAYEDQEKLDWGFGRGCWGDDVDFNFSNPLQVLNELRKFVLGPAEYEVRDWAAQSMNIFWSNTHRADNQMGGITKCIVPHLKVTGHRNLRHHRILTMPDGFVEQMKKAGKKYLEVYTTYGVSGFPEWAFTQEGAGNDRTGGG